MSMEMQPLYRFSQLDDIEYLERYRPGGYHPVSIGDVFCQGRFKVLHKLGFGGASTVWLARDQKKKSEDGDFGTLVSLKVLTADESSRPLEEIAEIHIPRRVLLIADTDHPGRNHIRVIQDHFFEEGPNGRHLCLVYPLAGPNISTLSESYPPGKTPTRRRLRNDIARKFSRQLSSAVDMLHSVGVVHGDLTSSNVLLRTSPEVLKWTENEIYQMLGRPETDDVLTRDGPSPGPFAPSEVVESINTSRICNPQFLEESAILHDFGQSFFVDQMPKDYAPAAPLIYLAPESHFDGTVSFASDVWALGCVIFEIRTGRPLFEPFLSHRDSILKEMVEMLGRFPDPWWGAWKERSNYFNDDGEPKPEDVQTREGYLPAMKSSIRHRVSIIATWDYPDVEEGPLFEKPGTQVDETESELLVDLLEKILKYRPEDRITMKEVMQHPWFEYE